ncbi:DUF874 domain-containing protein [Roseovarius sp. S1116L3]|uniref:DUF874 domain-containing protein n=1 Tax=Roseovarius roseus TaxID=3342636 RepID=UPI00372826B6
MGSIFSVEDFFDMLRRRRGLVLLVFFIGFILSMIVAAAQRHMYTSSEVLQMQGPIVPGEMAPSTVQGSSARRLQLIEQQIMSRGTILELIAELGLFADQPALTEAQKVVAIRTSVQISGVDAARDGYIDDGEVSLLRITANWPTAEGARALAHEISQRTVSLSVSTRLDQSRDTLEFFALQEDAALSALEALEREVSQFRAHNNSATSVKTESAQREIARLNEVLLNIDRQMIALQRQITLPAQSQIERRTRNEQQAQLMGLSEERALLVRNIEALTASIEGTPEVQRQLDDYARRMDALQTELEAAAAKRKEADVAYRLETQRQAARLTVLDPATLPEYPYTRSRILTVALGAVISALAAVLAAFAMDVRHPIIRSAAQMEHALGLRPVVSIPQMPPAKRRRRFFSRQLDG